MGTSVYDSLYVQCFLGTDLHEILVIIGAITSTCMERDKRVLVLTGFTSIEGERFPITVSMGHTHTFYIGKLSFTGRTHFKFHGDLSFEGFNKVALKRRMNGPALLSTTSITGLNDNLCQVKKVKNKKIKSREKSMSREKRTFFH